MINMAKKIDQWVEENTFWCQTFKARISKLQCTFNCAKSMIALNRNKKRKHGEFLNSLTLAFVNCRDCDRFEEPTLSDYVRVSYDKMVFKGRKSRNFFREFNE
jgi:hypothetical protein